MKPIKGYEGLYSINEHGDIISHPRPWVPTKRLLIGRKDRRGYVYVSLVKNRIIKKYSVHSLVAEAFLKKKEGQEVNHKDGVKSNNHLDNLEYVSRSDNLKHSYKYLGRQSPKYYLGKKGKQHNLSKYFIIKDKAGKLFRFESGGEFQRLTGYSKESVSYARKTGKKAHKFTKGKLKGFTVYF